MARALLRLFSNTVAYFVFVPLSYIGEMLWTDPSTRAEGQWTPLLYVFTSPLWPLVFLVVPLLYVVARFTRRNRPVVQRAALIAAGGVLLGTCAAVTRDVRVCIALAFGGAVFGAVFRVK